VRVRVRGKAGEAQLAINYYQLIIKYIVRVCLRGSAVNE